MRFYSLRPALAKGELFEDSVVKNYFTTVVDGEKYKTNFYHLDAIIIILKKS